jgi:hypothetical protein
LTSSKLQMPTVDRVKGSPAACAARAACASPRRAIMPAKPTGASATGIVQGAPNRLPDTSTPSTSTSTRWRKRRRAQSSTLAASVCSAPAPPST